MLFTLLAISTLSFVTADRLPVQLATPARPADVDGRAFDVVVVEGTPAGIACAVRAAREDARVLLVNRTRHLGGMVVNGLMQWDAVYAGHRAPLFDELVRNNARAEDRLKSATGKAWAEGLAQLRAGRLDPNGLARTVAEAERDARGMNAEDFAGMLPAGTSAPADPRAAITRREALLLMWEAIGDANRPLPK